MMKCLAEDNEIYFLESDKEYLEKNCKIENSRTY